MHIVFSMSCDRGHRLLLATALQDSATLVGRKEPIAQIISGCNEQQKAAILAEPRFYYDYRVHFAPNYVPHPLPGIDDWYSPNSKPFSLRHFLQNAYYWGLGPPYIMTRNDNRVHRRLLPLHCRRSQGLGRLDDRDVRLLDRGREPRHQHTIRTHLGATHPYLGGTNEYWSFLDGEGEAGNALEMKENPCQDPVKVVIPNDPPVATHFFHQLYAGEAYFTKRTIPNHIITRDHELLKLPNATEWHVASSLHPDNIQDRPYNRNHV